MATPAQIAANRRNAQHSTGPRTPEGKARVRLNSLVHGLRAQDIILPNEDPAAFSELRQAFFDQFAPQDALELHHLERLVQAAWRLRRVPGMERQVLIAAAESDLPPLEDLLRLTRYERALSNAFYEALNDLQQLQLSQIGFARQNSYTVPDPPPTKPEGSPAKPDESPVQPPAPPKRYLVKDGKLKLIAPEPTTPPADSQQPVAGTCS